MDSALLSRTGGMVHRPVQCCRVRVSWFVFRVCVCNWAGTCICLCGDTRLMSGMMARLYTVWGGLSNRNQCMLVTS